MIAHLRGQVLQCGEGCLLLDVGGVGYELHCSSNTLNDAAADKTASGVLSVWVHTYVREDCLQLFGFSQVVERKLFLSLIKVKGIGPKMALQILSALRTQQLVELIDKGDVKALTALPKVGKKTAEQMVLTLKGELVMSEGPVFSARSEIVSALLNLGFRSTEIEQAVNQLKSTDDVQAGVREALLSLG